ncbi:MAG TPA: diacylglycerol kinase family protein [Dehalococcoidia bacterium]|nr:diacylglycerol kinase family protein [Dehalococcoidia bacterium]
MPVTKHACLIVNPVARTLPSPDRLATAPAWLRLHGWTVDEYQSERPGHATELARAAADGGCDVVIAVGGDGTINEVINGLAGSETALAVIPAGTANVWAREVQMPRHPAAVARLLDYGEVHRIDLGMVNDRYFLLMASLGVDSVVVAVISPWAKRTFGRLAYVTTGVWQAIRFPAVRTCIRVDGERMPAQLLMLVVGNTRSYGGALTITNRAVADDGLLDVVLYNGSGPGRFVGYLARTFIGKHVSAPGTLYRRAGCIEVDTETPLPVQADGDVIGTTPTQLRVAPGALRVIVPPGLDSPLFSRSGQPRSRRRRVRPHG